MKLNYIQNYLSIRKFDEIEIEDFAVITGLNGSGKSHFLNALNNGCIQIENIDTNEIILYNYNDFNVFNFENIQNNINQDLFQKQQFFQSKSSNFSLKLNETRNQVLTSFNYSRSIQGFFVDDNSVNSLFSIQIFNWTKEDYLEYEKVKKESNNQHYSFTSIKHNRLHDFFYNLQEVYNIQQFIEELKLFCLNQTSLMFIRSNNYSIEHILNFKKDEIEKIRDLVAKDNNINFWNENIRANFSENLLNFCEALKMLIPAFDFTYISILIEHIPKVYQDIVNYFSDRIDKYSLRFFKDNDQINLSQHVQVGNGFFNLNELAQEEKNYQLNKKQNEYNEFLNSKNGNVHYHNDESFLEIFGESPVSILNKVLEEYDCNGYEFKQNELYVHLGTDINQQNINISLYNKNEKYITNLESLSSGEKTLLALAFSIYKLKKIELLQRCF